jgi:hypothetical protein
MNLIRKLFFVTALLVVVALDACAQGVIELGNPLNNSRDPAATSNGLVWTSRGGAPSLIYEDFNVAFYIGATSNDLPLVSLSLLSNGTASGDCWDYGIFHVQHPDAYAVPGGENLAFVRIQAWTGNYNSYDAAAAGGGLVVQTPVFSNQIGVPPGFPMQLFSMPAMVLSVVPEPSTTALVGFAGLIWLFVGYRRIRRNPNPGSPHTSSPTQAFIHGSQLILDSTSPPLVNSGRILDPSQTDNP